MVYKCIAGASYPHAYQGQTQLARSLFWEHEANGAIRQDNWKLVSVSSQQAPYTGTWERYNPAAAKAEAASLPAATGGYEAQPGEYR